MRISSVIVMILFAASSFVGAAETVESIRTEKRNGDEVILIKGRIKSRHAVWRKGKSVRQYYVVTADMVKIELPRSHVEHRDGTVSGIVFKPWRGRIVEVTCEGRIKEDVRKGRIVTVEKVISICLVENDYRF